ncbi:SemiSWEET transporter [Flavobacteriaceae bacterium]|nr:SemiSWEET transporter [Flavobacteriaceae bacterium]|tara:strand:+ start:755 stop:1021 length:267 start_codon:yes stop_codon:yes gene_type:complete
MIDNIELIGLLAAILTTTAFIPQVYKVIKTKSVKGLSLTTYLIFTTGVLFWLIYGLLKSSISMIIGNGITFLLAFSILYYILKNRNSK